MSTGIILQNTSAQGAITTNTIAVVMADANNDGIPEIYPQTPIFYTSTVTTGNITLDCNNGPYQEISLTGNATLMVPANGSKGKRLELLITPISTDKTLNFDAGILKPTDSTITLPKTLTGGKTYIVVLKHLGFAWSLNVIMGGYSL